MSILADFEVIEEKRNPEPALASIILPDDPSKTVCYKGFREAFNTGNADDFTRNLIIQILQTLQVDQLRQIFHKHHQIAIILAKLIDAIQDNHDYLHLAEGLADEIIKVLDIAVKENDSLIIYQGADIWRKTVPIYILARLSVLNQSTDRSKDLQDLIFSTPSISCFKVASRSEKNYFIGTCKEHINNILAEVSHIKTITLAKLPYFLLKTTFRTAIYFALMPIDTFYVWRRDLKFSLEAKELKRLLHDTFQQVLEDPNTKLDSSIFDVFDTSYSAELQIITRKFGFSNPEKAQQNEVIDESKPNIIIRHISEDSLALAREIDKQGGANVIIILNNDSWEVKRFGTRCFVVKGAVYKNDKIYNVKFDKPIRGHYLFSAFDNFKKEQRIKKKNVIPVSNINTIPDYTNNKEVCSAIFQREGLSCARSICFRSPQRKDREFTNKMEQRALIEYAKFDSQLDIIRSLRNFVGEFDIVVKPTNGYCGIGVKFFTNKQINEATQYIDFMLREGSNIIVEERIRALDLQENGVKKDWNLRVFVSRDKNNKSVVSGMVVRIDDYGKPVNISISAGVMTFDDIIGKLNLNQWKATQLKSKIEKLSLDSFNILDTYIRKNENLKLHEQQDWMGVDIMIIQTKTGDLEPVIVEINDHHAGGMWDLDNIVSQEEKGRSSKDLASTMIRRANEYRIKFRC